MDPMAEKYYSISPYAYCANNPINVIDPDGKDIIPSEVFWYSNSDHFKGSRRDLDQIREVGGFELSPYYKGNDLIGWSAYRNGRIQYLMDKPNDIDNFTKNANVLAVAADVFYMNGTPSEGQIAMAAKDYGTGLAKEWGNALTSPAYYVYAATAIGTAAMIRGNATTNVYRVYGGDAKPLGQFWTPTNPNSVTNYRNAAGLPIENSGRFVIEGTTPRSNYTITKGGAAPIKSNKGGLPEYIITDPTKITIKRVSGVNPQF